MRIEQFLEQSPIFQTSRIARRMDAALAALLAGEDLSVFEALVLAGIFFEKKGSVNPSTLAETFQTTRGNVSHCVSSLEAKGLLERRLDPEDARALQLTLKPPGRRRAVRVVAILDRMQNGLEKAVGNTNLRATLAGLKGLEQQAEQIASTRG